MQELRRADVSSRRRNRGRDLHHRRCVRRGDGRHRLQRTGHRAEGRRHGPGRDDRAADDHHQRAARRALARACRPRPNRPTCCRPCSAATASARCRSSPPAARPTASTWRRKPGGSPCDYMTPVMLLTDGYIANGSEPWRIPDDQRPQGDRRQAPPGRMRTATPSVHALRPRREPRPALGHARHAGPDAPHRRPGEAGRHGQRELRSR